MDAAALDRFLASLQAAGVSPEERPALHAGAETIVRVAAGAPIRPIHVDEALRHARWRGADPATVAAIRRAGERLVAWQRETGAAAAVETAVAESPAPAPEGFRWASTVVQVSLAVALLVGVSRVVSIGPPAVPKPPAAAAMDELVRRQREDEAALGAAEGAPAASPRAGARETRQPAAGDAFQAGRLAAASGELAEARREFTRAVAFEPEFAEAYRELSAVNLRLARNAAGNGERSDALRYFQDMVSDRRRANQISAMGAPVAPTGATCPDRTLADLERLARDDAAALAWLGWRPTAPRAPSFRRYAGGGYRAPAGKPRLPGPTRVTPSVVRPSRVEPTVVEPSYP